jgi:tetratricopeptide (TPR) repeat protein
MASTHRDEISRLELLHAAHPDGLVFPHLADAYRRAGRYSQAEVVLTAGLRRHTDYSSAHLVLGRLRLDQGKREEARSAFERVLQLDPQNYVALEYMGELALEDGRLGKALHHFRALQKQRPDADLARRIDELAGRVDSISPAGMAEPARVSERGADGGSDRGPERGSDGPVRSATNGGVANLGSPEPDEVVTETIAELYARQGLHARAVAVYRELIDRNPGDERLKAKLAELGRPGTADPDPGSREAPGMGIRVYLSSVLSWNAPDGPDRPEWAASDAASALGDEPWAEAPVSTPRSAAGTISSGPLFPPGGGTG